VVKPADPGMPLLVEYPIDGISLGWYIQAVTWEIEYTDEFEAWWLDLTEPERESSTAKVGLLEERGPQLGDPHTSQIKDEGLI
jgi:hypothetical protein